MPNLPTTAELLEASREFREESRLRRETLRIDLAILQAYVEDALRANQQRELTANMRAMRLRSHE